VRWKQERVRVKRRLLPCCSAILRRHDSLECISISENNMLDLVGELVSLVLRK